MPCICNKVQPATEGEVITSPAVGEVLVPRPVLLIGRPPQGVVLSATADEVDLESSCEGREAVRDLRSRVCGQVTFETVASG